MFKVGDKVRRVAHIPVETVEQVSHEHEGVKQCIHTDELDEGFILSEKYELFESADDAEPITREWLLTLPGWEGFLDIVGFAGFSWGPQSGLHLNMRPLPRVKTRGQLRHLLELIGDA